MLFDRFKGYGFIHHRSLNEPKAFRDAVKLAVDHPERTQILEGDICWDHSGPNRLFYFRHPSYVVDTLPAADVARQLRDRSLVGLDMLDAVKPTSAFLVVELKVGRGDSRVALRQLVSHLEANFPGRYWIDGFSLTMLKYIKEISPQTTVTLHTECVSGGKVLVGAPEWPPLRFCRLADLDGIDGIAVRRRGSEAFMARSCADVRAAGKALLLSRLHTLRQFECSRLWGAKAGYMHWPFAELLAFNDGLDSRPGLVAAR